MLLPSILCTCVNLQIFVTLSFSLPSLSPTYKESIFPLILPSLLPLTSVTLSGSVYCVVALAVERYLHLARPHQSNKVARLNIGNYFVQLESFSLFKFFCQICLRDLFEICLRDFILKFWFSFVGSSCIPCFIPEFILRLHPASACVLSAV